MPGLPFLLANWRWAVPTALLVLVALYAGVQHMEVLSLKEKAATELAAAEEAKSKFLAADAIKTAALEAAHAATVQALKEKANAVQLRIAGVATSDVCLHSPAGAAFLGSLPGTDKAGDRQPGATPGPHAAVPLRTSP